jgi:hypothetical protein
VGTQTQIKIPDFLMGFGFGWVFGYPTPMVTADYDGYDFDGIILTE